MYQILAYRIDNDPATTDGDMIAIADPNFSRRGGATGFNHFIFTEPYVLQAAALLGANVTRAQFNTASWNAIAKQQIYPPMISATVPTDPRLRDLRAYAPMVPINEEVAIQETNGNGAAGETNFVILWISPEGQTRSIPRGVSRIMARFTAAMTCVADEWSGDAGITMQDQLKGGTYAVVGAEVIHTDIIAARFNFVRPTLYRGRKLQPGCIGTEALGNKPLVYGPDWLGEMGRFNNFELPQISTLSHVVGAKTVEGRLDMVYLGETMAG